MVHGIPRRIRQQMGIPHRHRDGLVPHQGLDPVDIGTCQSKPRAERVAERMEDNAILGAGTVGVQSAGINGQSVHVRFMTPKMIPMANSPTV